MDDFFFQHEEKFREEFIKGIVEPRENCFFDELDYLTKFYTFMRERNIPLLSGEKFYNYKVRLTNHLTKCQVYVEGESDDFIFPLEEMANCDLLSLYNKTKSPNLTMFLNEQSPSIVFTRMGYMMLAGGVSTEQIYNCLTLFCWKVLYILKHIYPRLTFRFRKFEMANKVATTTLIGKDINVLPLVDALREKGFYVDCPDAISFTFVKGVSPIGRNITITFSEVGGIIILGFVQAYQLHGALAIIAPLIKQFMEDSSKRYSDLVKIKEQKGAQLDKKKQPRRQKKLNDWFSEIIPPLGEGEEGEEGEEEEDEIPKKKKRGKKRKRAPSIDSTSESLKESRSREIFYDEENNSIQIVAAPAPVPHDLSSLEAFHE